VSTHSEIEILLIEDNPCDAELALNTLRKRNLANQIVHVKDGQEALDWLFGAGAFAGRDTNCHPKFVLLDLKLPKVDGLEVLRAIRADERTSLLPVVVMTSSGEERDVVESYRLGANSYVVKPLDFDSFSAAVAELGHYWLLVNCNGSGTAKGGE
jgi:two-component system, response regulator